MKNYSIKYLLALITIGLNAQNTPQKALSVPVKEQYFGIEINDPYRNLEDLKSESTLSWLKVQSDYAKNVLTAIPGREGLIKMLQDIDSRKAESISGVQILDSGDYFYLKTTPSDQLAKLYKREGLKGKETLIFDVEKLDKGASKTLNITSFSVNEAGSFVAVNFSRDGGEMNEMILIDLKKNAILPERIDKLRFGSANWLKDGVSFIYIQSPTSDVLDKQVQSELYTKVHKIGQKVTEDHLIFSKAMYPELNITNEELPIVGYDLDTDHFYFMPYTVNPNQKLYLAKNQLQTGKLNWKLLFDRKDEVRNFSFKGNDLYLYTSLNAPNFKLIKTSLTKPDIAHAKVVIEHDLVYKLESFTGTKDKLFYTMNKNGIETKLFECNFDGSNRSEINTPTKASTIVLSSRGYKFSDLWVSTTGWTSKSKRYRYDVKDKKFSLEQLSTLIEYPEFDNLEVEEVMVKSHDGVEVPLSLIYKKGTKKDGENPVLFYGYGSYGISMTPAFNPQNLLWVNKGGILAIAHVRGGGELGKKWHLDGQKSTKQNTWKDVIACAEYMIKEKYTNSNKTAIYSRSAGGIFVGRAITERPDLFAVAIPGVGAMNTVRMENTPNGAANIAEFGTMLKEDEAKALIGMDSYLNLKPGVKYPATLTTAGFNDPRIIVWQPAKFAAKLLEVNASEKPTLLKVDYEAGHFGGASKQKGYEEIADVLSFALWQVGHKEFQVNNN